MDYISHRPNLVVAFTDKHALALTAAELEAEPAEADLNAGMVAIIVNRPVDGRHPNLDLAVVIDWQHPLTILVLMPITMPITTEAGAMATSTIEEATAAAIEATAAEAA